ncbi:MAG: DUF559 domain-containing protein [Bacillota bacterium]|nr:DUF559 domain-containing protein [Bacillota bacterium]
MEAYLSHLSALVIWNFPLAQNYFGTEITQAGGKQSTVFSPEDRLKKDGLYPYLCPPQLASHGILLRDGRRVVSPPLMFVQLASQFDLHQTIILGNLLCSQPRGLFSSPLLRCSDLEAIINEATGLNGVKRARQVLRYVQEGACSIMEVFVHLFLSLPNQYGGLGLSGGVFNYEVILDEKAKAAMGQQSCFIDYCFPELKIAYEYQGEQHNRTVDQDSRRTHVLRSLGYNVITITCSQLYTPLTREHFFAFVLKQHGVRQRIRSEKYEPNLQRLHELLPRLGR